MEMVAQVEQAQLMVQLDTEVILMVNLVALVVLVRVLQVHRILILL